jgi:hypothetical protein
MLQLAQILGQLGEFPTCVQSSPARLAPPESTACSPRIISDCHPSDEGAEKNENIWIIGV